MSSQLNNPITEDDIANYLANAPDFFERHADLLASVQLTSPHSRRTVSLQERQAEMLRDKIKLLEQRMMEMMRYGNENALLSERLLRWAGSLFALNDPAQMPQQVAEQIRDQFAVPQTGIKLWGLDAAWAGTPFAQGASEDAQLFAASLSEPFCGVNTGFEPARWLADPAAAASIALLPLRAGSRTGPTFGLIVLASPDSQRYHSGMGTELLQHLADIASAALQRLR